MLPGPAAQVTGVVGYPPLSPAGAASQLSRSLGRISPWGWHAAFSTFTSHGCLGCASTTTQVPHL